MAETTFAARAKQQFWEFAPYLSHDEPEFVRLFSGIFDSEDLVDKLYEIFLALIVDDGWRARDAAGSIADIGTAYLDGFYLPCEPRVVLAGQVDLRNDRLPEYAGLVTLGHGEPAFQWVRRCRNLPVGVAAPPHSSPLAVTLLLPAEPATRADRRLKMARALDVVTRHVAVKEDGTIVPCVYRGLSQTGIYATMGANLCLTAALAINAWEDSRHLWRVETAERVVGGRHKTPLRLGVSVEHVKSLFYARQAPLTESGRRRPILHWVRAHQRRIAAGIDIDVRKHLRGIEAFEMDGFAFRITQPTKAQAQTEAA